MKNTNDTTKRKVVVYLDDLIQAIQDLPNCPNGYSDTYDKAELLSMVERTPKHYTTVKNNK